MVFPNGSAVNNPPAMHVHWTKYVYLIPGLGRSPGGGHGNPLPYSCLEYPMDRGAWRATVHWEAKSPTQLKQLSMYTQETVEKNKNGWKWNNLYWGLSNPDIVKSVI